MLIFSFLCSSNIYLAFHSLVFFQQKFVICNCHLFTCIIFNLLIFFFFSFLFLSLRICLLIILNLVSAHGVNFLFMSCNSTYMVLLPEEFIIYISLAQHFRMLVSYYFQYVSVHHAFFLCIYVIVS